MGNIKRQRGWTFVLAVVFSIAKARGAAAKKRKIHRTVKTKMFRTITGHKARRPIWKASLRVGFAY